MMLRETTGVEGDGRLLGSGIGVTEMANLRAEAGPTSRLGRMGRGGMGRRWEGQVVRVVS